MGGRLNFLGGKSMKIDNYIKEEIIIGKDNGLLLALLMLKVLQHTVKRFLFMDAPFVLHSIALSVPSVFPFQQHLSKAVSCWQ